MNFKCLFCNKTFSSELKLNKHYTKKNPCIGDTKSWIENKNKILEKISQPIFSFNQEQLDFINSPLIDCKLIGIPGGGKTRCIIEKIHTHLKKNDYNSKNDYLILSFSKRARFDFIQKGKIHKSYFTRNNVRTLHSLSQIIISKFQKNKTSCLDTIIIAALNIIKKTNAENLKELELFSSLKTIFLDESQDISGSQFELIMLLKEKLNCNLVMVGDPNQNIYQFQGGSDKYLLNYPGKTFLLKKNYRSTKNIIDFTNSISPNSLNQMEYSYVEVNHKINIIIDNINNIKNNILKEIKESEYDLSEIAIIGPVRKSKPISNMYLNIGLTYIVNFLEENNIDYVKYFKDSEDNIFDNELKKKDNHVNILTIHGSKGLEFKHVILVNFHFHTFGINVSIEEYNKFKYLWYVATSRAMFKLSIYSLGNKPIWPLLKNVSTNTYNCNKQPIFNKLMFIERKSNLNHSVTGILKKTNPENLYRLESLLNHTIQKEFLYKVPYNSILDYEEYSALYGLFIEKIFEYYYSKKKYVKEKNIFYIFKKQIFNSILVEKKRISDVIKIIRKLNYNLTQEFTLDMFHKYKNMFSNKEISIYNYIESRVINKHTTFSFIFENEVIIRDEKTIIKICDDMIKNYDGNYIINIFYLVLYKYQIETESGFLWKKDFTKNINSLKVYINKIESYVETIDSSMEFGVMTQHPNIPIIGIIDILEDKEKILDIKFTNTLDLKHIIQVLLYYNNIFPDWSKKKELYILNLKQGIKYKINISPILTNYTILKELCSITNDKLRNLLFIYDLETDGLDTESCNIIERYFLEYNLNFILSNGVININKSVSPFISELTGITNSMIDEGDSFDIFKNEINELLSMSIEPRFMAHNGRMFDHRIMIRYKLFTNIKKQNLLDSRYIIRMLMDSKDNNLTSIFKSISKKKCNLNNFHRADFDVLVLRTILKTLMFGLH